MMVKEEMLKGVFNMSDRTLAEVAQRRYIVANCSGQLIPDSALSVS